MTAERTIGTADAGAADRELEVLLLPAPGGKWRLFSPALERAAAAARHEAEDARRAREAALRAERPAEPEGRLRRAGRAAGRAAGTLARRAAAGFGMEGVLRALRRTSRLTVRYPAQLSEGTARAALRELLEGQVRRHRRWLAADAGLLPAGIAFTLVPGPNLLFAWLALRTAGHWAAQRGGTLALDELPIALAADPGLDPLVELAARRFAWGRRRRIRELGRKLPSTAGPR